ncbi:MAG TPA: UvrD-helicase domain-containing protein [Bryobacteraceae bacterium]|nr:UvrD-helicase domain-containing protein [Bryobacteraceae bacterium]
MIADKAARLRALDVSQSFIVQAPAGSGKTELLIQRYLKLLETVETPDAVVAITFTRKAAGEMRSRVMQALRAAQRGVEPEAEHERLTFQISRQVLAHEQKLGWDILRNPARLRIETIDALCASITRRMPWLARFGAMPEISEKAEDLYREAARNTLAHLEHGHPGLAYVLLHLDNDFQRARQLLTQMLEKRDQWLRHTGANLRDELEGSLQRIILEELAHLSEVFRHDLAAEATFLCELERFPGASLADLDDWKKIADLLLTKTGDLRKRAPAHAFKGRCEQLLANLRGEDALIESLARFRDLPAPQFTESQWQAVEAAVSVLKLAVGELQLVFRERGRVDFPELSIRASDALGQVDAPEDLALALGQRIQHFLVDEFQDTSVTQFQLIEKLTAGWEPGDGRTLFLVGDPMQSIYRFRQADVSLFLNARVKGLGAIQLEPLTLSVNFRSLPDIVEWVNGTFASILPAREDPDSGAVAYSASVPGAAGADALIAVHAVPDAKQEAVRVLELLAAESAGTVAVLVRSRAHLMEIVRALKRRRIAFQAIEIDELGERQVVEDLMALTFALLHAADRVSWLAVLRAPWCGLTLDDLLTLSGADHRATIWDLLHRPQTELNDDGRARIGRILPVLEQAIAERGRLPLRHWVENAWLRLGGPACAEDETALEDAAAYFDLLEGLAAGADLADFEWFHEQVNALFAQPNSSAGEHLQVMTIHKAKGLEFDTVILPGLGAIPRGEDQRLLLWLEHRGQLLLAPISESGGDKDPIYAYLESIELRKSKQEAARLLYVAATRARRNLHLLGSLNAKADGTLGEPKSGSFLKLLWPAVAAQFAIPAVAAEAAPELAIRTIRRLPPAWQVPAPAPAVEWERRGVERMERQEVQFHGVSDLARYAGAALHGFLQRIAREGLAAWDEAGVRSRRDAYRAVLANLGVAPHNLAWAVERVESGLLRTMRDPRGRWVLENHSEASSELPIAGLIGGNLFEGVMDRTFVDENGVRWIIDYKTSAHEGGDLQNFLEKEKDRYREQLERYARLMVQRDDRPIRLGLYFPLQGEWLEWSAPVVLHKQATLFEL